MNRTLTAILLVFAAGGALAEGDSGSKNMGPSARQQAPQSAPQSAPQAAAPAATPAPVTRPAPPPGQAPALPLGQAPGPLQPLEIVRARTTVEVNEDGSFTQRNEQVFRVLSQQGVELLHQATVVFDVPYQQGAILEAYTLKADGRRIDVPPDKMMEGYGATSAPGFAATKQRIAFFQNVEVGDRVGSTTLFRQVTPWFPGQFEMSSLFPRGIAAHDVEITLTAPRTLALKLDMMGFEGGTPEHFGDKVRRTWRFHNDVAIQPEPGEVFDLDTTPHVLATTFPDFAAVAGGYRQFSAGKATPDDAIRALAVQLTAGVADRREQARRLYDWVSKNIKYVAIVLGNGGLVPHAATEVLANRYGDCKDHVVLLQALLAAKGIDSTPVLIASGSTYRLPKVALSQAFDHVITYIPELSLYLDSTAKYAPFGVLPSSDADKPVVLASTGALARTPVTSPANASFRQSVSVKINEDGSATGETRIATTGAVATDFRGALSAVIAGQEQNYLQTTTPLLTTGSLTRDDPLNLSDPFNIVARYTLANAATFPGPRGATFVYGYHPVYMTGLVAPGWQARRTDYVCLSLAVEDQTTIEFPANATIVAIPKTSEMTVEDVTLSAQYERLGPRSVRETLRLRIAHPHAVCTADYYNRVRAALTKLQAVLNAQVIYQ